MSTKIQEAAKSKLENFLVFKGTIYAELQGVHEKLEGLQKKFKENLYSEANQDGLLINSQEDYLKCL